MNKRAEQAALKAYPVDVCGYTCGCEIGDKPEPLDYNERQRTAYQEGYEQAEKDLVLTADDIARISGILCNVYEEAHPGNPQTFYKEVLRRFNEWREKK